MCSAVEIINHQSSLPLCLSLLKNVYTLNYVISSWNFFFWSDFCDIEWWDRVFQGYAAELRVGWGMFQTSYRGPGGILGGAES